MKIWREQKLYRLIYLQNVKKNILCWILVNRNQQSQHFLYHFDVPQSLQNYGPQLHSYLCVAICVAILLTLRLLCLQYFYLFKVLVDKVRGKILVGRSTIERNHHLNFVGGMTQLWGSYPILSPVASSYPCRRLCQLSPAISKI